MIPVTTFAGKRVAVFGLGASGLATAQASPLAARPGTDGTTVRQGCRGRGVRHCRRRSARDRLGACRGARARAGSAPHPSFAALVGRAGARCRGRGDRRHRAVLPRAARPRPEAPFVAITGTNGKSTTTALIAHLSEAAGYDTQLGGNIGTPILALAPPRKGRVHVIECSSFQIDLAPSIDPSIGILINLERGPPRPSRHNGQLCRGQGIPDRRRSAQRHRGRRRR